MTKEELEHNHIKEIAEKYVHECWGTYLDLDEVDLVLAGIGIAKIITKEKDKHIVKLEKKNAEAREIIEKLVEGIRIISDSKVELTDVDGFVAAAEQFLKECE